MCWNPRQSSRRKLIEQRDHFAQGHLASVEQEF